MIKYICVLASLACFAACEQKETTVTNPPGENKTEKDTTIVKESPATSTKTESNTTVNTGSPGTSTSTTTTTGSSPSP